MRWKDVLIGSLITLIITVIGGIIVYYFTKEPSISKEENIKFEIDKPVNFKSENRNLSIYKIKFINLGNNSAEDLHIGISFKHNSNIIDKTIAFSTGLASGNFQIVKQDKNQLVFDVATLTPSEYIITTIILNNTVVMKPFVSMKSKKTIGSELLNDDIAVFSNKIDSVKNVIKFLVPIIIIFQIAIIFTIKHIADISNIFGGQQSVNNISFILIHKGYNQLAEKMLYKYIFEKGCTSYELANYGLCLALNGNYDDANSMYESSLFYSSSKNLKGLVLFNQGITAFKKGEKENSKKMFQDAILTSKKNIIKYANFSKIIKGIIKEDNSFEFIFHNK